MKFNDTNIDAYLYKPGKYFVVPEFQRSYSWQNDNVKSFLDDIESYLTSERKHYFGTVVSVADADDPEAIAIIDGQQRVTTTLLMLTAIYHLIEEDPSRGAIAPKKIQDKYLYNDEDWTENQNRIRLKLVKSDNEIFKKIFNKSLVSDNEKKSRIYKTYEYFIDYFKDKKHLEKYIDVLAKFSVVEIELNAQDDNPQRVFESINSTGKPLTDGDKIRNFALMLNTSTKRNYVLSQYWRRIEDSLTDFDKDYISDFFRSYVISKRQAIVNIDMVYPEFKKLFGEQVSDKQAQDEIDNFYSDILKKLEYYQVTKLKYDEKGRFNFVEGRIFNLGYIQIELYIPFSFCVFEYYDEGKLSADDVKQIFNVMEAYFARRIIANIAATSAVSIFANLHRDIVELIEDNPDVSYVEAFKYLLLRRTGLTRMPSDSDIKLAIENNQTYTQRNSHVKFILCSASDNTSNESPTHLLRVIDSGLMENKITIEHVMPQTLNAEWRKDLGEEVADEVHEKYLHTLANLTLTGYNSPLSNNSFAHKKNDPNGFAASPLGINKFVKDQDKWDEETLIKRQAWWMKKISKIWPYPTTEVSPSIDSNFESIFNGEDLTWSRVQAVSIFDEVYNVSNWAEATDIVLEHLYDYSPDKFEEAINDKRIARFFSRDKTDLWWAEQIYETGIYAELGTMTVTKRDMLQVLAELFDVKDDIKFEIIRSAKTLQTAEQ